MPFAFDVYRVKRYKADCDLRRYAVLCDSGSEIKFECIASFDASVPEERHQYVYPEADFNACLIPASSEQDAACLQTWLHYWAEHPREEQSYLLRDYVHHVIERFDGQSLTTEPFYANSSIG